MLEANHSKFAEKIFDFYLRRLLTKSFNSIHLIGEIPKKSGKPIILAPNHSTWWDGFFVYLLNKVYFKKKFHIMILEQQLRKYKFFLKLGGFSIDKSSPKTVLRSMKYSANLIKNENLIVIFPQGELLPNHIRPLGFKNGINKIVEMSGHRPLILPLSMKIEFLKEQKPSVFFKIGKELESSKSLLKKLECEVTKGLECIGESIIKGDYGEIIFSGEASISDRSRKLMNKAGLIRNDD